MEPGVFISLHPTNVLMMITTRLIRVWSIVSLLMVPVITGGLDLIDGDRFPTMSDTQITKNSTIYRFLPKSEELSFTTTGNSIISKPTTVFLPPSVESVKIEPTTYTPTELSDEIQAYYSYSMVWYGIFYALYFFISN